MTQEKPAKTTLNDPLLTPAEAAKALRLSMPTLSRWRNHGGGPAFIRLGYNRVVYRRSAIEAWLENIEHDVEEKEETEWARFIHRPRSRS